MSQIMIVEDDSGVRRTLTTILEEYGYQVSAFEDAETALEWFGGSRANPDAAILDIKLPGINGFELAQRLRNQHQYAKVIFCSGFIWEDDTYKEMVGRGYPFFEKPLKFKEFLAFLKAFIETGGPVHGSID